MMNIINLSLLLFKNSYCDFESCILKKKKKLKFVYNVCQENKDGAASFHINSELFELPLLDPTPDPLSPAAWIPLVSETFDEQPQETTVTYIHFPLISSFLNLYLTGDILALVDTGGFGTPSSS